MATWSKNNTGKPVTTDIVRSSVGVIAARIDNLETGLDGTDDLDSLSITGGSIDDAIIGGTTPSVGNFTQANIDNITIDGNTITATGDLDITATGDTNINSTYNNGVVIGRNSLPGLSTFGANWMWASIHVATKTCKVNSLGVTVGTGLPGNVRLAIYSDNSGVPNSLLAQSEELDLSVINNYDDAIASLSSDCEITKGEKYWLAIWSSTNTPSGGGMLFDDARRSASATVTYGATFPSTYPSHSIITFAPAVFGIS